MYLRTGALATQRSRHGLGRRVAVYKVAWCTRGPKVEEGCSGAHDISVFPHPRCLAAELDERVRVVLHLNQRN